MSTGSGTVDIGGDGKDTSSTSTGSSDRRKLTPGDFELGRLLGEGSYARVGTCFNTLSLLDVHGSPYGVCVIGGIGYPKVHR
jgi:hypothetical protein